MRLFFSSLLALCLSLTFLNIVVADSSASNVLSEIALTNEEGALEKSDLAEILDPSSETNRQLQYDALVKVGDHLLIYGDTCPPIKEFTYTQNDFRKSRGKRIVHFYDAQCRGCQRFKKPFMQYIRQITSRNKDIEVYTVSCDVFRDVCVEAYAAACLKTPGQCRYLSRTGFPSIFVYGVNEKAGAFIPRFVTPSNPGGYIAPLLVNAVNSPRRRLMELEAPIQYDMTHLYGQGSLPVLEFDEFTNDFRKSNAPKIVQFYDATSSGSQAFKQYYLNLASQLVTQHPEAQIYAVGCDTYNDICLEAYAESCMKTPETCASLAKSGYPALLAYPANERSGVYLPRFEDMSNPSGYDVDDITNALTSSQNERDLVDGLIKVGDKFVLYGDESSPVLEYMDGKNDFRLSSNPKIVQFYDGTCRGCQRFKEYFLELAKTIKVKNPQAEVYAISCDSYLDVCLDAYATSCQVHPSNCREMARSGFPAILGFPAKTQAGVYVERFANPLNPSGYDEDDLLASMKPSPKKPTERSLELDDEETGSQSSSKKLKERDSMVKPLKERVPVVKHFVNRVGPEEEQYWDASQSFVSGLENNVFASDEPLSSKKTQALGKWLQLLSVSLPPEFALHTLIDGLYSNLETISQSKQNLLNVLDRHPLPRQGWSPSCSNGQSGRGYSCGMWKLLHIASVGFAEHRGGNDLVEGETAMSPMQAAETLREYIVHFFGCVECKDNFLAKYDDCSFNRCIRFSDNSKSLHTQDWKEFALWLWEVHNDVNLKVQAKKSSKKTGKHHNEVEALWPSVSTCLLCFDEDGNWKEEAVFDYLESKYWLGSDENTLTSRRLKPPSARSIGQGKVYLWAMLATAVIVIATIRQYVTSQSPTDIMKRSA